MVSREIINARIQKIHIRSYGIPEKRLQRIISNTRAHAKDRGIEFNISVEDIKWNDICPVLGIPIISQYGRGKGFHPDSPSIDRIDNSLGYIPGNVRMISAKANLLKNHSTREECKLIYDNWYAI